MFLLMGIGFLIAISSLISEWLGGCFNFCKRKKTRRSSDISIESNPRSHDRRTPRDSVVYCAVNFEHSENNHGRMNVKNICEHMTVDIHSSTKSSTTYDRAKHTIKQESPNSEKVEQVIDWIFEDVFGEENGIDSEEENYCCENFANPSDEAYSRKRKLKKEID